MPAFMTDKQVAEQLGLSLACLRQRRLKRLPPVFVKLGKAVRYRAEDIETWVARGVVSPADHEGGVSHGRA